MIIPEGFKEVANKYIPHDNPKQCILKLNKSIYGIFQAARAFNTAMDICLQALKLLPSKADPCLYHQKDTDGAVYMIVYVDDCILIGNNQAIQTTISGIKETFDITRDTKVEDFTGSTITVHPRGKKLYQPDLIETLITDFQLPTNTYSMPYPPGYIVTRDFHDKEMLSGEEMKTYRSGVGKLM